MSEVVGAYVVWREPHIADSVRSIRPWVDRLVFYSAPFHPDAPERDDTREKALDAAGDTPVLWLEGGLRTDLDRSLEREVAARNVSLKLAAREAGADAWAFVLDGDEILLAERTDVAKTALGQAVSEARAGGTGRVGISVYTTALQFKGHAPAITAEQYGRLPIVSSRGAQPRLFSLRGTAYRVSERGAPGLFAYGKSQRPNPIDGAVILNLRHRQSVEDYRYDYVWEER